MKISVERVGSIVFSALDDQTQSDVVDGLIEYTDDDPDYVGEAAESSEFPIVKVLTIDAERMAEGRPQQPGVVGKYAIAWGQGDNFPPIVISSKKGVMYAGTHRSLSAAKARIPFLYALDVSGAKLSTKGYSPVFTFPR